jgi:hypothetical protein
MAVSTEKTGREPEVLTKMQRILCPLLGQCSERKYPLANFTKVLHEHETCPTCNAWAFVASVA